MNRLVIRNSSLVYPPIPDAVRRAGDIVLPLVDRFDDAIFMNGPGYDALREQFPAFNLRTRALAREIGEQLPDWLGAPVEAWGHSVWDTYSDHFATFSLGPLRANSFIAERATTLNPTAVFAWELTATNGWWAGRQMVAEAAEAIARNCGVPAELSARAVKRVCRDSLLPALRAGKVLRYFHGMRSVDLPRPEGTTDVLFVLAGPTLVPVLDRIGGRLEAEHGLRVVALDTPLGGPSHEIASGDLPRWGLHAFSEISMIRSGMTDALMAAQQFGEVGDWLSGWSETRRLQAPFRDVLKRRLHGAVISDLPVARYNASMWEAALDALRPRVLVSFNSYNEVLAPGVLQARHRGIPTICLQHGIWGPLFRAGALLPHDDILIFGDYAQEMLAPLASEHTRFIKAGHSMYDDIELKVACDGLRADLTGEREHLVVVTTQPIEGRLMANEERWWLRGLAEACARNQAALIIKPHPQDDEELLRRYETLSREMPDTVRVARHGEVALEDLISASDLLVTRFSTTAFEAALVHTPVLTINLSGGPDQYPFAEEGCAIGVYEYDDIAPAIASLLKDGQTRRRLLSGHDSFLARHLGPRDNQATGRIAARIVERARER